MKVNRVSYLIVVLTLIFSCTTTTTKTNVLVVDPVLPFIGNVDYDYDDEGVITDTIWHTIPEFSFTTHDSATVDSKFVKGKIYVADFFFTNCPSICPIMTSNMEVFHENTEDIDELIILSHTIDPGRDTLKQLNKYITDRGIDTRDDWFFLYQSQEYTYDIGKYGYLINANVDPAAEGGFLHSEHFVLIDREGRIRGMYVGTNPDQVNQLEKDIRKLLKEEYGG